MATGAREPCGVVSPCEQDTWEGYALLVIIFHLIDFDFDVGAHVLQTEGFFVFVILIKELILIRGQVRRALV